MKRNGLYLEIPCKKGLKANQNLVVKMYAYSVNLSATMLAPLDPIICDMVGFYMTGRSY